MNLYLFPKNLKIRFHGLDYILELLATLIKTISNFFIIVKKAEKIAI